MLDIKGLTELHVNSSTTDYCCVIHKFRGHDIESGIEGGVDCTSLLGLALSKHNLIEINFRFEKLQKPPENFVRDLFLNDLILILENVVLENGFVLFHLESGRHSTAPIIDEFAADYVDTGFTCAD